jgi:hypothetical protein
MVTYALLAFALAAVGGLVLASRALRAKLAPWPLSLGRLVYQHGIGRG